ncbi:unnamed protein product, partial [Staurois parvus]
MYVKWFDTGMLYFLPFSNFLPVPSSVRPDVTGNGTWKTDAGVGQRTLTGTLWG